MLSDILHSLRWLRRNPGFGLAIIGILGLGVGANTAVFSIVDAVLLRALPYAASDRLVRIDEVTKTRLMSGVAARNYLTWGGRGDVFDQVVPFIKDWVTLTGDTAPDQVIALRTSGELFPLLGIAPRLGRTLSGADNAPGAPKAALLSDRLWRRRFQADPYIVGRAMKVSDEFYTIAGVMPPDFDFAHSEVELWLPLHLTAEANPLLQVIARRRPGVTLGQVRGAMEVEARRLEREQPKELAGLRLDVTPWTETTDRQYRLTLLFVLAAVGLVLLIGCADVGSLLLSRAVQRQKEIAIRASLGAGQWRVARQLLAESLVLAAAGSLAGILVGRLLLGVLADQLARLPIVLPHLQRVSLNGRVLLFNTALCLLLAILCSLAPVLLTRRTDIQSVLRGGRAGSGPRSGSRLFSILIAVEAAFAFLLLVGSGLMVRSLIRLQQHDHGIRPEHVLTLRVPVGMRTQLGPAPRYATRQRQMAYYNDILARLERLPGLQAVGIVNNLPLSPVNATTPRSTRDGRTVGVSTRTVSPQYFAAMGIPLLAGRAFQDADHAAAPAVAIINERLARELFPDRSPIGEPLPSPESNGPGVTIVGVVKDTPQLAYDKPPDAELYRPLRQFVFAAFMSTIVVRAAGDPLSIAATLQKEVWAVDPDQPVVKVETMEDVIANSIWRPRFSAWIFSVLGGLAVLLTCAGVYAVVAYTSGLRAHEMGIRVAVGASPRHVAAEIVRAAMIPLTLGVLLSVVASLLLSRLLESLLFEIRSADPVAYLGAAALILLIGAAASGRPAWRAAHGDPWKALRAE